jgi:hypothetical protein
MTTFAIPPVLCYYSYMSGIPTYENFADTPCPWVPDQLFWEQNAGAVRGTLDLIAEDFPHVAATVDFDPTTLPPDEQRAALWKLLMGRQHGVQEKSGGKVDIAPSREAAYREQLNRLRYGPHSIMGPTALDATVEYDLVGLTGGTPIENAHHLAAASGENVRNIVALTGQRLRGVWKNLPGERSVAELFKAVGAATETDMDELARRSPWIRAERERRGEGWQAPFATEHEIFRLVGEASMKTLIDWPKYADTVQIFEPTGSNNEMHYTDEGRTVVVPPREDGMVTYELVDGRKLHIVNGAATARAGMPRATSSSNAEEALSYRNLTIPERATMAAVAQAPHLRAAIDTAIAILNGLGPGRLKRFDVAASPWEPTVTHLVAALGEIMATMKADRRLRAVLQGNSPDTAELLAL